MLLRVAALSRIEEKPPGAFQKNSVGLEPTEGVVARAFTASMFSRPCLVTEFGKMLAAAPKDFGGRLIEYIGATPLINADCGDGCYAWLPPHEVAGGDREDAAVVSHRFPEVSCLLCSALDVALHVLGGIRKRRTRSAEIRTFAKLDLHPPENADVASSTLVNVRKHYELLFFQPLRAFRQAIG